MIFYHPTLPHASRNPTWNLAIVLSFACSEAISMQDDSEIVPTTVQYVLLLCLSTITHTGISLSIVPFNHGKALFLPSRIGCISVVTMNKNVASTKSDDLAHSLKERFWLVNADVKLKNGFRASAWYISEEMRWKRGGSYITIVSTYRQSIFSFFIIILRKIASSRSSTNTNCCNP